MFSSLLHPHCLLNINRCFSVGRRGENLLGSGSSLPICQSICPSTAAIATSASVLTGLFVHLYLCFFLLLFLCPPLSVEGGWGMIYRALMPLPPALAFYYTRAQAITKALLTVCYYSVMLLSGAGGRGGWEGGQRREEEGNGEERRAMFDLISCSILYLIAVQRIHF